MKIILLAFAILINLVAFAQPQEVTPAIEKKIKADIEKEVLKLKAELKSEFPLETEFIIDTFRIEKKFEYYAKYDNSDVGIVDAGYEEAHEYDSLLNKYYKKLLAKLNPADKTILIQAQKAWIAFRDGEEKLIDVVSKDEYSGGGSVQRLIMMSAYLELIKQRVIQIFNHLEGSGQ